MVYIQILLFSSDDKHFCLNMVQKACQKASMLSCANGMGTGVLRLTDEGCLVETANPQLPARFIQWEVACG